MLMSPRVSHDHKERRRRQILEAAARCLSRNGYTGTTMKEILAESRLSAGAVYNYFPGKEEIYAALLDQSVEELVAWYQNPTGKDQTTWNRLCELIHRHFGSFHTDRQHEATRLYLLDFLPASVYDATLRDRLKRRNHLIHELIANIISEGIERDEFGPVDPKATAALILAAGDGVRLHALTTGTLDDAERMYRLFIQNLRTSLTPAKGSSPEA